MSCTILCLVEYYLISHKQNKITTLFIKHRLENIYVLQFTGYFSMHTQTHRYNLTCTTTPLRPVLKLSRLTSGQVSCQSLLGSRVRVPVSPEGQLWWAMSGIFSSSPVSPIYSHHYFILFHTLSTCHFIFSFIHFMSSFGLSHHVVGEGKAERAPYAPPLDSGPSKHRLWQNRSGMTLPFFGSGPTLVLAELVLGQCWWWRYRDERTS